MKRLPILQFILTSMCLFFFLIGTTPAFAGQNVARRYKAGERVDLNAVTKPVNTEKSQRLSSKMNGTAGIQSNQNAGPDGVGTAGAIVMTNPGLNQLGLSRDLNALFVSTMDIHDGDLITGRIITPFGDQIRFQSLSLDGEFQSGVIFNLPVPLNSFSNFTQFGVYTYELFILSGPFTYRAAALLPVNVPDFDPIVLRGYQQQNTLAIYQLSSVPLDAADAQIYVGLVNVGPAARLEGTQLTVDTNFFVQSPFGPASGMTTLTIVERQLSRTVVIPIIISGR